LLENRKNQILSIVEKNKIKILLFVGLEIMPEDNIISFEEIEGIKVSFVLYFLYDFIFNIDFYYYYLKYVGEHPSFETRKKSRCT